MDIEQITLYAKRFACQISLDMYQLKNMTVTVEEGVREAVEELVVRVYSEIYTQSFEPKTITESKQFEYIEPKTWWDHFKMQNIYKWWMPFKNYNLETKTIKGTISVTFTPEFRFPDYEYPKVMGRVVKGYRFTHEQKWGIDDNSEHWRINDNSGL